MTMPSQRDASAGNDASTRRQSERFLRLAHQHVERRRLALVRAEIRIARVGPIQVHGIFRASHGHVEQTQLLLQDFTQMRRHVVVESARTQIDAGDTLLVMETQNLRRVHARALLGTPGERQEHDRKLQAFRVVDRHELHARCVALDTQPARLGRVDVIVADAAAQRRKSRIRRFQAAPRIFVGTEQFAQMAQVGDDAFAIRRGEQTCRVVGDQRVDQRLRAALLRQRVPAR